MKFYNLFLSFIIIVGVASCAKKQDAVSNSEPTDNVTASNETATPNEDYSELINTVYEKFVFAIDADPNIYNHPENYFTSNALQKLKDGYEFDCEDGSCYAYYELRTREQDSKPDTDGESGIVGIEEAVDGWYAVKYIDMGWPGMTRIKIADGKIDDFERCVEDL